MSLATRCTSCGTVFRVVQDQLKVSEGWVRCGRCDAVFDAAEGLFDLEREAPPAWSPTQPPVEAAPPARSGTTAGNGPDRPDSGGSATALDGSDGAVDGTATASGAVDTVRSPPVAVPADRIAAALARHAESAEAARSPARSSGSTSASAARVDADEAPSGDGWRPGADSVGRGRGGRVLLWAAASLLVVGLVAQGAARFSDITAARWPVLRPALAPWCEVAGCSLAAPRRIDDIVVDSSALAPVIGTDALKLGIALRNRAGFAVAVPSVDLSLTDSAGRLLARRTLHPADFRVDVASLAPGGDLPLQAIVTAGAAPVTGYTVEIFYP